MNPFDVIWAILALPPIIWEAYAIGNKTDGDTLSERTRVWWRTSTVPGKSMFSFAWVGFSAWLLIHIIGG